MTLRLRELRKSRNLSQQKVADSIGCSAASYSRYETGQRGISIDLLVRLADYYKVSVDYLLGRSEPTESSLSQYEKALVDASRNTDWNVREIVLDVMQSRSNSDD